MPSINCFDETELSGSFCRHRIGIEFAWTPEALLPTKQRLIAEATLDFCRMFVAQTIVPAGGFTPSIIRPCSSAARS